jgi:sulfate adenylyltransferase subunit 2
MGRDDEVLDWLEAEAVHIIRETVAGVERPVLLFSAGKDSAVLLHLARKAFAPAPPPFPLLHVDTTWKFAEMYAFRDAAAGDLELIVHRNPDALAAGINPFEHGASVHTDLWKTQGLRQALDAGRFDAAFGGARRDEEKSRAKERIVSVRTAAHGWDPRAQRPELWSLYNTRLTDGQTLRVFPLSNWTEPDVWRYVRREGIAVPDLYFAADRPVVERDGALILADPRLPLRPGETVQTRRIRFRTLGCWPLTGAVESEAADLDAVIAEVAAASGSERQGRVIDHDPAASMERKKREGYF